MRNKFIIFFSFLICSHSNAQTDWNIIASAKFERNDLHKKRVVTYLFRDKKPFVKYNPLSLILGGMMYCYQKTISVQIGAACPYEVNCSNFSKQCIQNYGLVKGVSLTADRLTRCTRLALIDMVDGVDFSSRRSKIFDQSSDYSATK